MDKRAQNEGIRVLDDFVCEAILTPGVPQAPPGQRGRDEGMHVLADLSSGATQAKAMTFRDFLEKRAQQPHYRERQERREEWITAVGRLIEQIRAWLAESDPRGVLDVLPMEMERVEPGLGTYQTAGLRIGLGEAAVRVVPVGRNAVGVVGLQGDVGIRAEGRVDITDGIRKYILYRTLKEGEKWYALDERFQAASLDRARLEEILQDLLS